jgi:ornithine cyclodeaminase/alanine dehydrogenase-like protein (mu-crystallin family)
VKLLVLSGPVIRELVGYADCADAVRAGLLALAEGRADQPLRTVVRLSGAAGILGLMPSYLNGDDGVYGAGGYVIKAITITPGNPALGLDSHQGVVLLSSAQTGEPVALLNASAITELRTAAASVVATGLLARAGASELAIAGTGVQARAHVLALAAARPLTAIRVAGRDAARARQFAAELSELTGLPVTGCATVAEAVAGAGIVVTATSSARPVLRREWLAPGAHVNAVGACLPGDRELDTATVAGSWFVTDRRESAEAESGDYRLALAEGAIGPGHLRAELGEILAGTAPGRTSPDQLTVFESLGLAVEDQAAAALAVRKATESGAGQWVEF